VDEVKIGHDHAFLALSDYHEGESTRSPAGGLWSVHARLVVPDLQAEAQVWLSNMEPSLPLFFAELAVEWRGWDGVKPWATYEGGLTLGCEHDGLGHVQISVDLRASSGGLGWRAQADVPLDAGQLDHLTQDLAAFVG